MTTLASTARVVLVSESNDLTDGALHPALEAVIAGRVPQVPGVRSMASWMSPYSTRFRIEEVRVRLEDGGERKLTLKDMRVSSMLPGALAILADRPVQPAVEIGVYRRLLPMAPPGPPLHLASSVRPGMEWVLLEQVEGHQLRHVGEPEAWCAAAAWIGRLHARFCAGAALRHARCVAPALDRDRMRGPWRRAVGLLRRSSKRNHRVAAEHIDRRTDLIVDRLVGLPPTFIHGQFYASNVVIGESMTDESHRVGVVDWETAAIGPGILDLAALTEGWPACQRNAMASAYVRGQNEEGCRSRLSRTKAELAADLTAARMQLCIELLALPGSFTPPPDQAKDWLQLALELGEEMAT